MRLLIQLSSDPISPLPDSVNSTSGAVITFAGVVRDREETKPLLPFITRLIALWLKP